MTRTILKNFRGQKALIVQQDSVGRDTLVRILSRLGLDPRVVGPKAGASLNLADIDILFIDTDDGIENALDTTALSGIPVIALVGSEAPSHLARAVRARAASHIQKPVRSTGIFTALLLAMNEHDQRRRFAEETATLRRRLAGRRVVVKAVLALMTRWGICDDEAYNRLRREAMHRRVPIEEAARQLLSLDHDIPVSSMEKGQVQQPPDCRSKPAAR